MQRIVENVQHPAPFAIQLDLVSKCLRVAGRFGLIDVVGDLRQRMLADNAITYFVCGLLITVESDPAELSAVIPIDPSALSLPRLNYPDEALIYVTELGIAEDFHQYPPNIRIAAIRQTVYLAVLVTSAGLISLAL